MKLCISPAHAKGWPPLDRNTFEVKWVYRPPSKRSWYPLITLSQVAILNDTGYVIFSDATLRAFDLDTGKELGYWQPDTLALLNWPICTPFVILGCNKDSKVGLATSDDTLFASFGDGKVYAFSQIP